MEIQIVEQPSAGNLLIAAGDVPLAKCLTDIQGF